MLKVVGDESARKRVTALTLSDPDVRSLIYATSTSRLWLDAAVVGKIVLIDGAPVRYRHAGRFSVAPPKSAKDLDRWMTSSKDFKAAALRGLKSVGES
jgi:hypothetical protein